jgi:Domain of unknown function (DUF4160)
MLALVSCWLAGRAQASVDRAPPRAPQDTRKQGETTHRLMPTVLRIGPYRFFFYAGDRQEPPHIHVEREDNTAKFWLDPVRLQQSRGFRRNEGRALGRKPSW